MQDVLNNCESRMTKCVVSLENEYLLMRTGRASAALFDKIKVDYYGTETPLNQVATISSPEARLIVIQPWDKTVLPAIEKAIQKSELGLNPNNDGKLIRGTGGRSSRRAPRLWRRTPALPYAMSDATPWRS